MDSEDIFEKPIDEPKEEPKEEVAEVEEVKPKKEKKKRKKRTMTDEQRDAMLARLKAGREKSMRNRKAKADKKKKLEKKRKELQDEYVDKELEKYTTERKPVKRDTPAVTHETDKPAEIKYNHKENSQKLHNKIDRLEQMILNMNKPKKEKTPLVTMNQVNNRIKKKVVPKVKPKPLVSLSTYKPRKWF